MFQYESQESPPTSPTSTISGPYIPISECISGRRLNDTSSLNSALGQGPEHYDAPRRLAPSPPRSPTTTDAESVFTDDEWTTSVTSANWDTLPSSKCLTMRVIQLVFLIFANKMKIVTGDSRQPHGPADHEIGSWSVKKRFGKLRIVDSAVPPAVEKLPAPPRPPKPPHMLLENPGHNYLNLDGATESSKPSTPATPAPTTPAAAAATTVPGVVTDESYDFPRSHQPQTAQTTESNTAMVDQSSKHFYSNAAPSTINDETQNVFRYDFHEDEPSSPRSENSTTATYSNLPSPLVRDGVPTTVAPLPPMVYRELKPGRKTSDSMSIVSNEPSPGPTTALYDVSSAEHSPAEPPSINRKLKPSLNKSPVEGKIFFLFPQFFFHITCLTRKLFRSTSSTIGISTWKRKNAGGAQSDASVTCTYDTSSIDVGRRQ